MMVTSGRKDNNSSLPLELAEREEGGRKCEKETNQNVSNGENTQNDSSDSNYHNHNHDGEEDDDDVPPKLNKKDFAEENGDFAGDHELKKFRHSNTHLTGSTAPKASVLSEIDVETALHHIMSNSCSDKEFLSAQQDSWITFRVGHAGDASTIASLFMKDLSSSNMMSSRCVGEITEEGTKKPSCNEDNKSSISCKSDDGINGGIDDDALELQLALGLGDEDTPPAIYCVFADVYTSKSKHDKEKNEDNIQENLESHAECKIYPGVAIVLFSLDWDSGVRWIRIEWFHVDQSIEAHDFVKRRLWFRLSALAIATSSQLLVLSQSM